MMEESVGHETVAEEDLNAIRIGASSVGVAQFRK
jgi:hypothetical protein